MRLAEKCISRWVIPNHRYSYDDIIACDGNYGILRPLRDLFRLNIATLLRKRGNTTFNRSVDMASCDMDVHRKIACCYYEHFCDEDPPADESQKAIYAKLSKSDDTSRSNLASKIARKREWDIDNATTLANRILTNVGKLKGTLSPYLRLHLFEIIHNAVPTRSRMRFFGGPDTCRLCGEHPETLEHLLKLLNV